MDSPNVLPQEVFSPAPFSPDSGLNIHQGADSASDTLVVFVHGLGGGGYETWGMFPQILFEDPNIDVDVAVFDYKSGARRLNTPLSADMTEVEEELSAELASVGHSTIILLGHSMGGLVAIRSLRRMFLVDRANTGTDKQFGVILFASPRAGSLRVPWFIFSKDARYLRAHSRYATEAEEFCASHINPTVSAPPNGRQRVPIYAARANRDAVVDRFSSTFGIAAEQRRPFRGTHTSIVKPHDEKSTVYQWTVQSLQIMVSKLNAAAPSSLPLSPDPATQTIVVEFNGHPLELEWHRAFVLAKQEIGDSGGIQILETPQAPNKSVELLVRVVRSDEVNNVTVEQKLSGDRDRQIAEPEIHLGISTFGPDWETATGRVYELVGDPPSGATRWITGTASHYELKNILAYWIACMSKSKLNKNYYSRRSDFRSEEILNREAPYGDDDYGSGRAGLFRGRL